MISVVVPTLNEAENVEALTRRIMACSSPPDEILFVGDGSIDGTCDRIRALQQSAPVGLIERAHPHLGLSGAVMEAARQTRGEIVVVMDADLSHPPEKIADLVQPLLSGTADMVIGSRYVPGASTPGWPRWRRVMSRFAAAAAFPLTGIHDSMSGFFATHRSRLVALTPAASGFKIAFELIADGGRQLRVIEIPIVFRDRARGRSKMSFEIALIWIFRWIVAASRALFRRTL